MDNAIRCGKGLVEPRFAGSLEGYIVVDTLEHPGSGEARVLALLRNHGVDKSVDIELRVCNEPVARQSSRIRMGEKAVVESYIEVKDGCNVDLVVNGATLDRDVVSNIHGGADLQPKVLLVFHNHQPPNYGPNGVYRSLWPFTYVWRPVLYPYGLGPYHYHASLVKKLGEGLKLVYNLSPSLIKQWFDAVESGVETHAGEIVEPGSGLARVVKETINLYRELVSSGTIEVLTSLYAHTISGYLVEHLDLGDIVARELEYGLALTKSFTGVEPRGVWLPEMSFSMKLLPILSSLNLKYTFLDEQFHLNGARGEVGNPYEPYVVRDSAGNSVVAFFRDTELSNYVGFANNYCSDIHATKGAYRYVYKALERCFEKRARVLTIALDGENWMALSSNPPATAVFLCIVLQLFLGLSKKGVAKLVTAKEVLRSVNVTRTLSYVPSTTWLGSYGKWRGEVKEHEDLWKIVESRVARFRAHVAKYGLDEPAKRAEWALWHALDSDYWWAEFWNKEMIMLWIREFDRYITSPAT